MSIPSWLIVPIAMNIVQLRDNSISIFLFSDYFECLPELQMKYCFLQRWPKKFAKLCKSCVTSFDG